MTLVLSVAVLLISVAFPGQAVGDQAAADGEECRPHPPIEISEEDGPQGFVLGDHPVSGEPVYRPGSGVVAGTGTAEDPYVIAGWCFQAPEEPPRDGLRALVTIVDTDAHVQITGNVFQGAPPSDVPFVPRGEDAIHLDQQGPVEVQGNAFLDLPDDRGIFLGEGSHEVEANRFENVGEGVKLEGGNHRVVANTFEDVYMPVYLRGVDGATVAANEATGGYGVYVRESQHVHVLGNEMDELPQYGIVLHDARDTRVENNTVRDASIGILAGGEDNLVANNTIRQSWNGIEIYATGTSFLYNEILETHYEAVEISSVDEDEITFRRNNVEESRHGLRARDLSAIDVRWNWWGHASGPAGGVEDACTGTAATGQGEALKMINADACFDPWLEEPVDAAGAAG